MRRVSALPILFLVLLAPLCGQSLRVTYPNGNETLKLGTPCTVTWTSSGVSGNVRLVLFRGETKLGPIATGLDAALGRYSWTAGRLADGGTVEQGAGYRVRIVSGTGEEGISDFSDAPFTLAPFLTFVAEKLTAVRILVGRPRTGEELACGSTATVEWSSPAAGSGVDIGTTVRISAVRQADDFETVLRERVDNRHGANSWRWFIEPPRFHDFPGEYRIRLVSSSGLRAESGVFQLTVSGGGGGAGGSRRDEAGGDDLALQIYGADTHIRRLGHHGGVVAGHDEYRLRTTLQLRNNTRSPSGAPRPVIPAVTCFWCPQTRRADGSWQSYDLDDGRNHNLTVGPVRSGDWTQVEVTLDFNVYAVTGSGCDIRIHFELDPGHAIPDPERGNNQNNTPVFKFRQRD